MKIHVIGAGPAGLAAAAAALAAGAEVDLIDDNPAPGGQVWRGGPGQWRDGHDRRAAALWERLQSNPAFSHLAGAQVVGRAALGALLLEQDGKGRTLAWERLILCTGARELHLPFPGWTLPGVVGAGGLQALIKQGMPVRSEDVVIAGSGPLLLASAATALEAGAHVKAIVEYRTLPQLGRFGLALVRRHHAKLRQAGTLAWKLKGVPYIRGARIVAAGGSGRVSSVSLERGDTSMRIGCSLLAVGFGLVPNGELGTLLGCRLANGAIAVDAQLRTSVPGIWAAGECTGIGGVDKSLAQGRLAALHALGIAPSRAERAAAERSEAFARLLAASFAPAPEWKAMCRPDTIVCRCEDVTAARLAGFGDGREAKLKTRVGMGACQGKTCGAACQFLFGWTPQGAAMPLLPASAATLAAACPDGKR